METINSNEVHGYVKNGFIILHNSVWDHDEDGHGVYVPRRVAINPSEILAIEETHHPRSTRTCVYYINREHDDVYENFEEIMDLINEVKPNHKVVKPLYD